MSAAMECFLVGHLTIVSEALVKTLLEPTTMELAFEMTGQKARSACSRDGSMHCKSIFKRVFANS